MLISTRSGALTLSLLAVIGCTRFLSATNPVHPAGDAVQLGATVNLHVGESADVTGEGLKIQFDEVARESRCPRGVTCVWEGDAVVKVTVTKDGPAAVLELHTSKRFAREASAGGYTVRLVNLSPEPVANRKTESREYVAAFVVSKAG